ncbi:unnamed protein product [Leuciscus chuanchicus]
MVAENARAIVSMKETVNENTKQIADVKTAVEFVCAEVNDVKSKLGVSETQVKKIEAISSEHEQRLSHLEGYTRRWNLRIYGIPEKEREDVRERKRKEEQTVPLVDKARRDNKQAYFVGGRAFVDGTENFPPT